MYKHCDAPVISWSCRCRLAALAAAAVACLRPNVVGWSAAPGNVLPYCEMRDDHARTTAYYHAIDALAPGKVVLDLGTGALALLALRCARAGAAHVYAVEAETDHAQLAARAVLEAGLQHRITVLQGLSQEVLLPRRVDLVVHELIGELASREGVAATLRDAAARHVEASARRLGGWSLPRRATTWVTPTVLPPEWLAADAARRVPPPAGPSAAEPARPRGDWELAPGFPISECALAACQPLEDLHFGRRPAAEGSLLLRQARSLRFSVDRAGTFSGLALHVTIDCGGGAPTISSANPGSSWANGLVLAMQSTAVSRGDTIELEATVDLEPADPTYCMKESKGRRTSSAPLPPCVTPGRSSTSGPGAGGGPRRPPAGQATSPDATLPFRLTRRMTS